MDYMNDGLLLKSFQRVLRQCSRKSANSSTQFDKMTGCQNLTLKFMFVCRLHVYLLDMWSRHDFQGRICDFRVNAALLTVLRAKCYVIQPSKTRKAVRS